MGSVKILQHLLYLIWIVLSHNCESSYGSSGTNGGKGSAINFSRYYTGVYFDPVDFMRHNGLRQILDESGLTVLVKKIHSQFDQIMIPFHIPPTPAQASSNILLPETAARENARLGKTTLNKSMKLIILCKVHNWGNISHIQKQIQQLREGTSMSNSIFPGTVSSVILEIGNGTTEAYQNYAMFRQFFHYQDGAYQPSGVKLGLQIDIETSASALEKLWKDNLHDDPKTVYISEYVHGDISGSSASAYTVTLTKQFGQYQKLVRSLKNMTEIVLMATWPDTSVKNRGKFSSLVNFWDRMNDWASESTTTVIFVQAFDTPLSHERRMMTNGWWRLLPNSAYLHPSQFLFEDKSFLIDIDNDKESLHGKMEWLREEYNFSRDNTGVIFSPNVLTSRIGKPNPYSNSSLEVLVKQISTKFSKLLISMTGVSDEDKYRALSIIETISRLNLNQSAYDIDLLMTFNESTVNEAAEVVQEANKLFPGVVKQMIFIPSTVQNKDELVGTMLQIARTLPGFQSMHGFGVQLNGTVCLDSDNFEHTMKLTRDTINSVSSKAKFLYISANINYEHTHLGVDRLLPVYVEMLRRCKGEIKKYFRGWNESIAITFVTGWPLSVQADLWELMEFVKFWEQINGFALSTNSNVIFSSAFDDPNAATLGWWKLQENDTYPETVHDFVFEDKKEAAFRLADEEISGKASPPASVSILGISAVTLLVFLIVFILFAICYFERRQKLNYLTTEEIAEFFKGRDPGMEGIKEPYKMGHFELSKKYFTIDETSILGSGAFGKVCMGSVSTNGELKKEVAVKMTKVPCPRTAFRALLFEIKILAYLGAHPHIVELVGAYTAELKKSRAFVFLELCSLGSLETYLRKQKPVVMNTNSNGDSQESVYMCAGVDDGKILDELLAQDMYRWSGEIAKGMEFIASKHIVHLDIASRNILLAGDKRAKITDFGLSRRLYDYQTYVKKEQAPLPWRWMAPESLRKSEFTEKSDVWGFGVLLWEIYSLGGEPYPGLSFDFNFATKLERGLRLDEPTYSENEIYSVMLRCWATNPEIRPTFSELTQCFRQTHLHDSTNQIQIDAIVLDSSQNTLQISSVDHPVYQHQIEGNNDCIPCHAANDSNQYLWSLAFILLVLTLLVILIMVVLNYNDYTGNLDKKKPSTQQTTSLLYNSTAEFDDSKSLQQEYQTMPTKESKMITNDKLDQASANNNNDTSMVISRTYPKDEILGQKLFNLIDRTDLQSAAVLIQFDADVNQRNEDMETPIIMAAYGNDQAVGLKFIKLFIDHGANLHARDNYNQTFLHVLVSNRITLTPSQFHDITEYLISKNQSNANLFVMPGWLSNQILFHIAMRNVEIEKRTLTLLHQNGVDFNVLSPFVASNVIEFAIAGKRRPELLLDLISEFGVDWRHLNKNGRNGLHVAAVYGSVDGMKFLLELGLDPNTKDNYGNTPIHHAVLLGQTDILEIVELLIVNGAKVSIKNNNGKTTLQAAKQRNNIIDRDMVIKLLADQELIEQGPRGLGKQLFEAISAADEESVQHLVESGADIDIRNNQMETPLFGSKYCSAVDHNVCLRITKYLIERGADAYAMGVRNRTFLHNLAAKLTASQFHDISAFLISKNLSELFNTGGFSVGATPLHLSVSNIDDVDYETLLLLERNGVDFNILDNEGDSVLSWLIIKGKNVKLIPQIVSLGTNWKQLNKFNRSLLHLAARFGRIDELKYFLSLGLNVNAIDTFWSTPLHRVAMFGTNNILETVQVLIENGANVLINNKNGRTPLEEAVKREDLTDKEEVLKLLRESERNATERKSIHHVATPGIESLDEVSAKTDIMNGARNSMLDTFLHMATISDNKTFAVEMIRFLIDKGANASDTDGQGDYTFLNRLFNNGSPLTPTQFHDAVEFLISKNLTYVFNIHANFKKEIVFSAPRGLTYSSANNTAFQVAVRSIEIKADTLNLLRRNGVDFNAVNGNGDSVLHFALMGNRSVEMISELVALGVDPKHLDYSRHSLLHTAAAFGEPNQINFFVNLGLDINAVGVGGLTPLHFALKYPNENSLTNIQFLIRNGANIKAIDKYGRVPIYFALKHVDFKDKDKIIQLLTIRDNQQ